MEILSVLIVIVKGIMLHIRNKDGYPMRYIRLIIRSE